MIEEYIEGIVIGYHGFVDCRIVEDVIDGGTFIAADMIDKYSSGVTKVIIKREWFGPWRNEMKLRYGNSYNVKWCDFYQAVIRQIYNN
ncbi:hypothetical protein B6I74_17140 [Klebsiella variicola]|uniref:hypothetical protein n=1 Tax=Klebsiella TaxID=570 RepID=UPI000C7B8B2C|nr:hypothetical protein [Klebsiella variicola]EJD6390197.1 hypothetical protein [Klebsiella pneumoniae]PLE59110.1 hypothetical protein B6I74_17140 [Klebsiella variicola]HCB0057368.1 hypothetical protein [Klebsiella pneumoniae]HDZ1153675.1 hypothetical protein [Klebsiella pneumoniae]